MLCLHESVSLQFGHFHSPKLSKIYNLESQMKLMFGKSEWMVYFHSCCLFSEVQAPKSMFLDRFVSYKREILLFVYKPNK